MPVSRSIGASALALALSACTVVHTPPPTVETKPGTAQEVIGPSGGTLSTPDDTIALTVPRGALDHDVTFTVGPTTSPLAGALATVFEIGPLGTQFAQPAAIAIRYTDAELAGGGSSDLVVATVVEGRWQALDRGSLDPARSLVRGDTPHLSLFAIVHARDITLPTDAGRGDAADGASAKEAGGEATGADASADASADATTDASRDGSEGGAACSSESETTGSCANPTRPVCSIFPGTVIARCTDNPASGGYAAVCCATDAGDGGRD